ncbi:NAD(P)H-dependent oxidoreductase [Desulfovibrio sp. OttesenSCG-928-C14]|nr:NAD(P)H-dependent oxidoreductase [Desulfovibrio sp. OttesenSCG-928-C14]
MCGPESGPERGKTLSGGKGRPLLLCASPRRGNSLLAAEIFARELEAGKAGPGGVEEGCSLRPRLVRLDEFKVLPCVDCGACSRPDLPNFPGPSALGADLARVCPLAEQDDSPALFTALLEAPLLLLSAPVYFYHLPARLKGLLDRVQAFYQLGLAGKLPAPRPRPAFVILSGARPRGENLFKGALLTLKYALPPLGLELRPPLLLYGLEGPRDLERDERAGQRVRAYAGEAGIFYNKAV